MRRLRRASLIGCLPLLAVVLLLPALPGCTAYVAKQIEVPGRAEGPRWTSLDKLLHWMHFHHRYMDVAPGLRLSYWYAWPHDLGARIVVTHVARTKHGYHGSLELDTQRAGINAVAVPARGSIVLLPPWGERAEAMSNWGILFASDGYTVVMPDLRSQGDSSTAPVGYGPREAGDVAHLLRTLRAHGELPGPLYVLGHSYGATVGLFLAARMPRIRGVVALAPYANAAAVIRRAPRSGLFEVDAGPSWLSHWVTSIVVHWLTPARMNRAISRASQDLGVNLDKVDAGPAVAAAQACEVIVHGTRDHLTSAKALRALSRQSPRAAYISLRGVGHIELLLRTDWLFKPIAAWLQALPAPGTGTCPALAVPRTDPLSHRKGDGGN